MRLSLMAVTAAIALAAAAGSMISTADAQARRGEKGSDYGLVTAESRYGPQKITAPVRYGTHGRLEVRLPGGTWIECGRSCRDTLRRETVDFWYNHNGNPDGPGYFRFSFGR